MASTPHPPSKPADNHKPASQPAPSDHRSAPHAPAKSEPPKPTTRSGPAVTPLYAVLTDPASLFKNGHRIAKEGDPPEKWISMGRLADGSPVFQTPMTPELEQEIRSGSYYLAEGISEGGTPPPGPPVVVDKPHAQGTATVGSTLTCTQGNWTNTPTNKTYQWLRGGTPIAAATSAGYVLVADDLGAMMSCEVTAINAAGQASSTSNEVGPVVA